MRRSQHRRSKKAALHTPRNVMLSRLRAMSLTPTDLPSAEFGAVVKRDLDYWDTVARSEHVMKC
jgi:hypothetical protein